MPVYVNQQAESGLFNQATGAYYPAAGDLAGNMYIRQSMWPSGGAFTFSNYPTKNQSWVVNATAPASGTVWATPIYLPSGFVVQNITFVSGTTAATAPLNQWFGLANSALAIVATTADDTSTAWAASTAKTLAISKASGATAAAYQVPTANPQAAVLYYALICVAVTTTVPTLTAVTTSAWAAGQVPKSGVTDQTGKTTPLTTDGTVTVAITANATVPLVGIS